ncbi:MAG: AMIN domain-containing protein [Sulfuricurvum sp.]
MKTILLVSSLLTLPLAARDNPFFPSSSQNMAVTSNTVDKEPPLTSFSYTLPDHVRILKEVTYTFQNVDGSIETQKVQIERGIDWHKALIISQGGHNPAITEQGSKRNATIEFDGFRLQAIGKALDIATPLEVSRHFLLTQPSRIVVDFKSNREFRKIEKEINSIPFRSASLESHGSYLRLSIVLDGRYRYSLTKQGGSVHILCK